ncbi:MAG: hypothetical protein KF764_12360 [Labilithrix sp.]|nr:hypothetical protein [Labilithrix sp.]
MEEEPTVTFSGREHVTPQAFGRFETNNLVLKCVCDACNHYFSHYIDRKLARDSAEAIDRITMGLKSPKDFQSMGRRSTMYAEFMEGPMAGRKGYAIPSRDGKTLGVMAFPQVVFSRGADDPNPLVFRQEHCPTADELKKLGFSVGDQLLIQTWEIDDPWTFLETKGFKTALEKGLSHPPQGRIWLENVTLIAEPEYRVATKIALNYLAAVVGHVPAREKAFDDARNFARYGSERARVKVVPFVNPHFVGRRGHYISLRRGEQGTIIAQMSILMRTLYCVVLSTAASGIYFYSTAHVFDLDTRRLKEIEPLPYTKGFELKKTTRTK